MKLNIIGVLFAAGVGLAPAATPPPAPRFSASGTVIPVQVSAGQTANLNAKVTSSTAMSNVIVDLEIRDQANVKVAQKNFTAQNFSASQSLDYSWPAVIPSTLQSGTYSFIVAVLDSSWSTTYLWDSVASISVVEVAPTVASPAEDQGQVANQIANKFLSESAVVPAWVLPALLIAGSALLIAGFAIGYGVRSLVSIGRRRRARRSLLTMTSHGQPETGTPQMQIFLSRDERGAS